MLSSRRLCSLGIRSRDLEADCQADLALYTYQGENIYIIFCIVYLSIEYEAYIGNLVYKSLAYKIQERSTRASGCRVTPPVYSTILALSAQDEASHWQRLDSRSNVEGTCSPSNVYKAPHFMMQF
jgi:hypothetical protein